MTTVGVKIGGREYYLACDDGQEEQLRLLADDVDDRVRDLSLRMGGNVGEIMGLLLTAITMADELIENKKEIDKLSTEVRYLSSILQGEAPQGLLEAQNAVADTIEEIARRIETIAERVEMR